MEGRRKDRERGELFANRLKSVGWTVSAAAAVALDRSHVRPRELAPSIVLCDDWALSPSLLLPFSKEAETPLLSPALFLRFIL